MKTHVYTKTGVRMFIAASFIIAKEGKQYKCPPTAQWKSKMWYIHINKILIFIISERNEVLIHVTMCTEP